MLKDTKHQVQHTNTHTVQQTQTDLKRPRGEGWLHHGNQRWSAAIVPDSCASSDSVRASVAWFQTPFSPIIKCKYEKTHQTVNPTTRMFCSIFRSMWTRRSSRTFGDSSIPATSQHLQCMRGSAMARAAWRGLQYLAFCPDASAPSRPPPDRRFQADACVSVFLGERSALTGTGRRFVGPYCHTPPPIVLLIRGRTAHAGTASKLRPVEVISIPLLRLARADQAAHEVVLLSKLIGGKWRVHHQSTFMQLHETLDSQSN